MPRGIRVLLAIVVCVLLGAASRAQDRLESARKDPAHESPVSTKDALSPDERAHVLALTKGLGGRTVAEREAAAQAIRERFGIRAVPALLEVARTDLDPERRFRARALVCSVAFVRFLEASPNCGWLGVKWNAGAVENHFFAAHVVEALPGNPAARGGIRARDEIVKWNGEALEGPQDFIDRVQSSAPDSTVKLTVVRGGAEHVLHVVMGTRVDEKGRPDVPYPNFKRDMAWRRFSRWIDEQGLAGRPSR